MRRALSIFGVFLLFSLIPYQVTQAANTQPAAPEDTQIGESFNGSALCLPDVYLQSPGDCLPLGPSTYLTQLAQSGITLPLLPLPAVKPDPALNVMKEQYLSIKSDGSIPLYNSLEDAEARTASSNIAGSKGLKYLAIIQRVDNDRGIFFQLVSGTWINAADEATACCTVSGRFQGLLFKSTPTHDFGWVINPTPVKQSPGYNTPDVGKPLNPEEVVQVYGKKDAEGTTWLMIGVDQWVDDHFVARVTPETTPPQGVKNNRWIEVNEGEQTLSVYDQGQLVFATWVVTGKKPFYTRPGLFTIQKKKELETMTGSFEADHHDYYYLEDVPWTMYFDQERALHGAYWPDPWGYTGSHGCVNIEPGDAHWLFDWAKEGDNVYVWDPTGQTPTDPKFYGQGGA